MRQEVDDNRDISSRLIASCHITWNVMPTRTQCIQQRNQTTKLMHTHMLREDDLVPPGSRHATTPSTRAPAPPAPPQFARTFDLVGDVEVERRAASLHLLILLPAWWATLRSNVRRACLLQSGTHARIRVWKRVHREIHVKVLSACLRPLDVQTQTW